MTRCRPHGASVAAPPHLAALTRSRLTRLTHLTWLTRGSFVSHARPRTASRAMLTSTNHLSAGCLRTRRCRNTAHARYHPSRSSRAIPITTIPLQRQARRTMAHHALHSTPFGPSRHGGNFVADEKLRYRRWGSGTPCGNGGVSDRFRSTFAATGRQIAGSVLNQSYDGCARVRRWSTANNGIDNRGGADLVAGC